MKVVAFAGFSGSGKTTLVEQLIPAMKLRGLRVSVVKHAHHKFDIDHPGKDTWRHREAGAFEVVAASRHRLVLMREFEQPVELGVHHLLASQFDLSRTTIFIIWTHALFLTNGDSESYQALSWKYKSGRHKILAY